MAVLTQLELHHFEGFSFTPEEECVTLWNFDLAPCKERDTLREMISHGKLRQFYNTGTAAFFWPFQDLLDEETSIK